MVPGLPGVPAGEVLGLSNGLDDATGTGVVTGLTGSGVLGSQAPNTATLAARRVEIINDLLIVFFLIIPNSRTHAVRCTDITQPDE